MILLLYLITGFLALAILPFIRSSSTVGRNHHMNIVVVIQAVAYLGITIYTLIETDLPVYYPPDHYLFIDALGIYEIMITAIVFLSGAVYARGYVDGLLEH